MDDKARIIVNDNTWQFQGNWDIENIADVLNGLSSLPWHQCKNVTLSAKEINKLDSAGALLLQDIFSLFKTHKIDFQKKDFNESQEALLALVEKKEGQSGDSHQSKKNPFPFFHWLGFKTVMQAKQIDGYMVLFGQICVAFFKALLRPSLFEFKSITRGVEVMGFQALTIVALLSFLIGVVLAYQMGIQLETYGASIYIAYICGVAILREFGPLISAIIVAGRTSSSFTAQIGSMKVREEIDAMKTMGFSPVQLLVLPKIIALMIAFPLLVFCADIFGVIGSMIMAKLQLGISYIDFLHHFKTSVGIQQFVLGMLKAPFFAFIIAMVGCYQGFQVQFSANSVGLKTTTSVVQAIFLIIVADAIFSVIYTWLGV